MPAPARTALFAARTEIVVHIVGDSVTVDPAGTPVTVDLGDPQAAALVATVVASNHKPEVTVVLPQSIVLTHTLRFPAAVESDLRAVLHHELDRLTPFAIANIAFDYRVRDRIGDKLLVELALVPRPTLRKALDTLAALGLVPTTVTTNDEHSARLPLNLLPRRRRLRLPVAKLAVRPAFGLSAAALVVAALYLPLARYDGVLAEQTAVVEGVRVEAVTARARLAELEGSLARGELLAERRRAYVPPVALLRELTARVPDHTWLARLSINRGQVQLQGESAAATELLQVLESTELLEDAEFQAPVARSDASAKEQFTIVARLARSPP